MIGKGRKKVEINLINDPSFRMVCFSKRRKGLFKKAEELSILSGAKIAVLAFSQAGKLYCSDTKTMDSLLCTQVDNSSEILSSAPPFTEAMDGNIYYSDAASLNPLLCPQFDISTAQEEDNCWEFDFAEAMAGKEMPFWFNGTNVQAMGLEELRRLERAIWDYGQLQFAKSCY